LLPNNQSIFLAIRSNHYDERVAATDVDLDFDRIGLDAVDGGGANPCEHESLWHETA